MATRSLGQLTIDLIAKIAGFEQGMDKAARAADKRFREIEKRAKVAGAVIGAAIAGGVAAATASIKSAIDRMDEMSKAAQRAMMPTEQFSQLAYAGSLADVALTDLTNSMGKLARTQGAALEGGKSQAQAFKTLGIEIANADGAMRSTREVFLDFADVFQKNKGSPEVMALGMQVFGRSFQNLIPLLKDGRQGLQAAADEADRLGVTLTDKAGRSAEEFNDNLTRVRAQIQALWQGIAVDLLPDLVEFSNKLNSEEFRNGFSNIINGAVGATKALVQFAATTANVANWVGEELAARFHGAAGDDIVRLTEERDRILSSLNKVGSGSMEDVWNAGRRLLNLPTTDDLRKRLGELHAMIEGYKPPKPLAAPEAAGVLDTGTGNLRLFDSGAADKSARDAAKALKDLERAQEEAARRARDFTEAQDDARRSIEDIRAEVEGPTAQVMLRYSRMEHELDLQMAEGVITLTQYADAMELVHQSREKALDGLVEKTKEVEDAMTVFADEAARNMQTAFADFLFDPFDEGLSGMVKGFSDALRRMAAEFAASQFMDLIFGNKNTGQGGLLDLFMSSGWGYASGGYTGPGGKYEPAGVVHKGEVVWSQSDVARAGGVGIVEAMRRGLAGYANGGSVGSFSPVGPQLNVTIVKGADEDRVSGPTANSRGGFDLKVFVKTMVNEGFGDGSFDGAMSLYGMRRQGAR